MKKNQNLVLISLIVIVSLLSVYNYSLNSKKKKIEERYNNTIQNYINNYNRGLKINSLEGKTFPINIFNKKHNLVFLLNSSVCGSCFELAINQWKKIENEKIHSEIGTSVILEMDDQGIYAFLEKNKMLESVNVTVNIKLIRALVPKKVAAICAFISENKILYTEEVIVENKEAIFNLFSKIENYVFN